MEDSIDQPPSASLEDLDFSKIVEPAQHKRTRLKAQLPLQVRVLSVTNECRDLDIAYYHKDCPLAVRQEFPLPTIREAYEASIELNPHLWMAMRPAAKHYRCSESTIRRWIRAGELKSVVLCGKQGSRRMRRIYRSDLDRLLAELARRAPNSKWEAVAAATPSIVELRRAHRRRARQAALQAEFETMCQGLSPKDFFEMAANCLETAT
jgi:excisionase family DNA binding protein